MGRVDPAGVPGRDVRHGELPLQVSSPRTGRARTSDQGDLPDACALRLSGVHVLLRREGWQINPKKTYRIYHEMGLQLRNKTPKRRVKAKLRDDRKVATGPNRRLPQIARRRKPIPAIGHESTRRKLTRA